MNIYAIYNSTTYLLKLGELLYHLSFVSSLRPGMSQGHLSFLMLIQSNLI